MCLYSIVSPGSLVSRKRLRVLSGSRDRDIHEVSVDYTFPGALYLCCDNIPVLNQFESLPYSVGFRTLSTNLYGDKTLVQVVGKVFRGVKVFHRVEESRDLIRSQCVFSLLTEI